ncbi:ABC transporter substrate-binding protein [Ramlibacter sp.]|uniref:ABC transporter substrate-binding protein n=1 Tax=Ramlibacter sp. TaxID=1917967 RepID=UPI003D0CDE5D
MKTITRRGIVRALASVCLASAAALPAAAQEVTIGVMNALTGTYAFGGVPYQNAMKMALEEANAKRELGAVRIKIVEGDTAGDKAQSLNLLNQFARRDRVLMVLGPTSSGEALGAVALANELKVPMFAAGLSNDILAAGPWTFKMLPQQKESMTVLAKHAVGKMGIKRIAFVFDQGSDGYTAIKNAARDAVRAEGGTIVAEEGIQASESNFMALATKAASMNADAIFMAAPAEVIANIAIQFRQSGLPATVRLLGPPVMASQNFLKIGGKAVEGSVFVADYVTQNPSAANQTFIKTYTERFKVAPDNWAAVGYTLGRLAVEAIKNAGPNPDREKVRAELAKLRNVPVLIGSGRFSFDEGRNPMYGATLVTVRNGQFALAQ